APAVGGSDEAGAASLVAGSRCGDTAFRADLQGADRFELFLSKHFNASLPPGSTLAQCAMKSDRHAERMASRSASVGCCAAARTKAAEMKKPVSRKDPAMEKVRMGSSSFSRSVNDAGLRPDTIAAPSRRIAVEPRFIRCPLLAQSGHRSLQFRDW